MVKTAHRRKIVKGEDGSKERIKPPELRKQWCRSEGWTRTIAELIDFLSSSSSVTDPWRSIHY
jgi:hypothetical protein